MNSPVIETQAPEFRFAVGQGWWPLLDQLHQALTAIHPDYQLTDVKEKWGALHVAAADRLADDHLNAQCAAAIRSAIHAAQHASVGLCEVCGEPGQRRRPHGSPHGWIKTRCPTHQR
ncbi:MAG: hypothetical protein WCA46_09660 [Actinocatenispora sp.]